MPTLTLGRKLVQEYLENNHIKSTELAKIYGIKHQDATDYISGSSQTQLLIVLFWRLCMI